MMKQYKNCSRCTPSILFFGLVGIMLSAFLSMSCEPGANVKDHDISINKTNIKTINFVIDRQQ